MTQRGLLWCTIVTLAVCSSTGFGTTGCTKGSQDEQPLGGTAGSGPDVGSGGDGGGAGAANETHFDWQLDPNNPTDLSKPDWAEIENPRGPSPFWGQHSGRKPTNVWWLGLVLEQGTTAIAPLPYHLQASASGLGFGLPSQQLGPRALVSIVQGWLSLEAVENLAPRRVSSWDDMSVTMEWLGETGSMNAPMLPGMPYVTMRYRGLTPRITGSTLSGTGTRFVTTLNDRTWIVYTSEPVTFDGGVASAPLDGWVRVAHAPNEEAVAVLDEYAAAIPVGTRADMAALDGAETSTGIIQLSFVTENGGKPLMMALPHHLPHLDDYEAMAKPIRMETLKGVAQAVAGEKWSLHYELSKVGFRAPRALDPGVEAEVRAALEEEEEAGEDLEEEEQVYRAGKMLAKLARLALIAEEVGETELMEGFVARLKHHLERWLNRENPGDPLAYDTVWGGVISECVLTDPTCDHGQGIYNDHHFHYGYFVYAAAAIARIDPSWAQQYGEKVRWLIRDYANPYYNDPYFPRFRAFDFYNGHSWASGLTDYREGRNQESTSESVNSYYALQLWGEATGDETLRRVGHILRMAESAGAQTYWQVRAPSDIYPLPFGDYPCIGILWSRMVEYRVFWTDAEPQICGIQMLPVTPASEDMLNPQWVSEVWDDKIAPMAEAVGPDSGWRDFLVSALANWDKARACEMIRTQNRHDNGNSKANMLYYCGTRP